jgi:type IV pilus assembly protein PilV
MIEVLVAMVIILVGLLGLLQSVNVATEHNLRNQLREEAVQIGEEYMNTLRLKPFSIISSPYSPRYAPSRLRGITKNYVVIMSNNIMPNSNARELVVKVGWAYKNISSQHQVSTVKSQ